jgi:GNAT superfamily N-acetyltransferase
LITLADATPDDAEAVAGLCAELDEIYGDAAQGTPPERAAQVLAALSGRPPMAAVLLARDGHTLAGFASYSFLWPASGLTASLYLKELYVAGAYRRGGTGRLLMDGLRKIATDRGCSRVEWTTDAGNTGARAFYNALGAKPLTSQVFYRMEGMTSPARCSKLRFSLSPGHLT